MLFENGRGFARFMVGSRNQGGGFIEASRGYARVGRPLSAKGALEQIRLAESCCTMAALHFVVARSYS